MKSVGCSFQDGMEHAINLSGDTFNGMRYGCVGVYTDEHGRTYAGQVNDEAAHGLGVHKVSDVATYSGGYSAGNQHGYGVCEYTDDGEESEYYLHEHGNPVQFLVVYADGSGYYDGQRCGAEDVRLVALKAAGLDSAVRRWVQLL